MVRVINKIRVPGAPTPVSAIGSLTSNVLNRSSFTKSPMFSPPPDSFNKSTPAPATQTATGTPTTQTQTQTAATQNTQTRTQTSSLGQPNMSYVNSRMARIQKILDDYYSGRDADKINDNAIIGGAAMIQADGTSRDETKSLRQWLDEMEQLRSQQSADTAMKPYQDTMDWLVKNWQQQWGDESVIQPFESRWNNIFGGTVADIQNLPSSTEFLTTFMQNFGLDKIATGEVKPGDYGFDMWKPEYLKKLLEDGANIPGFDSDVTEADTSTEKNFVSFLMDTARSIVPNLGKLDINLDDPMLSAIEKKRFAGAMQLIEQPGMTQAEFEARVAGIMEPIRKQAELSRKQQLGAIGNKLMGRSTIGPSFNRRVDAETEMTEAVLRGQLTTEDVKMRQENMQMGLAALADLNKDKLGAIFQKTGLQNEQAQSVLNFLSDVGKTIAGRIGDEQSFYLNKMGQAKDFFNQNANRLLQEKLGLAGLELNKYEIDTDAGLKKMLNDYQVALQNRGINSQEAQANVQSLLDQWKLSSTFAQMDENKLATIAELAAKGQAGDQQAWATYNGMILEETLKNRGMNNDQANSISQLVQMMYTMDRTEAFNKWAQMNQQRFQTWREEDKQANEGGFLNTVGRIVGMGVGVVAQYLGGKKDSLQTDGSANDNQGGGGDS